jgi:nucleotide-binding universal stress UspA family protein
MLNGNKGRLHILYIIEVERTLPIDAEIPVATAKGDAVLRRMEEVAKPFKLDPQAELLQSRQAGYAVVQEAVNKDVDAIVMAVPYQTKYGEFSLGTTIPYVFEHAPCQVILWRDGRFTTR